MASNYDDLFEAAGQKYNVDPRLLKTVFRIESGGNPNTPDSYQGAQGGMQMLPQTAAAMGASDPHDMTQAIPAAAKYLAEGLDATGTPQGALAYYHGGPDRAQWGPKTAAYVAKGQAIFSNAGVQPVAQTQPASDPFSATLSAPAPDQAQPDAFSGTMGGSSAEPSADPFSATLSAPAPDGTTPATAPQASASGLARNAAAGVTDAAANTINTIASPSGTLGKMVGTLVVGAHDALAPYLGYQRLPDDVRNMLLGDQVPQAGTQLVNRAGKLIAGDKADVSANTPAEALTRKVVGGAGTALLAAPGGATAALAGAAGAATGDAAGKVVPAWAAPSAELLGNIAGGAAVGGARAGANKLLSTDSPLARTAVEKYGIPLRAGQVSDSKFVRTLDDQLSKLPGTGMGASNAAQRSAIQQRISNTFGENTDQITPKVMQAAKDRIGGVFNDVAKRTDIPADAPLMNDLLQIGTMAQKMPSITGDVAPHIKDIIDTANANGGSIPGKAYQALVGKGSALERAQQTGDGAVRSFANDIREALDDAFERAASPEDAKALAEARLQYKNMMTVAPLVNRGTPGEINTVLLQSAANRSFKQNAFKGAGDLGEIGDIGQFLKSPPDSGTATRTLVNGTLYGDLKSLGKLAAGITAGRIAGSVLRSNPLTSPGGISNGATAGMLVQNPLLAPPAKPRKAGD